MSGLTNSVFKMEIKLKKCKGTGQAKGSGCTDKKHIKAYGLCYDCYVKWLLNTDNGKAKLERSRIQGKKRVEKETRKISREQKQADKSIQKLIQEARGPFHKWIRFRDANESCISCGSTDSSIWDAGHFYKAELYSGLIFDEKNVHKQCGKCNRFLGGNEREYKNGLIKRYGKDYALELESKKDRLRTYKYSREELEEIKLTYLKKLKDAR